jgi:hypothetical protein
MAGFVMKRPILERDRVAAEGFPGAALRKARRENYPDAVPGSRAEGRGQRARRDSGHVQVWHAPHELNGPGFPKRRDALPRCRAGDLPVLFVSES